VILNIDAYRTTIANRFTKAEMAVQPCFASVFLFSTRAERLSV